ncbi:hypothetical protein [Alteriqipengyuania sp.]
MNRWLKEESRRRRMIEDASGLASFAKRAGLIDTVSAASELANRFNAISPSAVETAKALSLSYGTNAGFLKLAAQAQALSDGVAGQIALANRLHTPLTISQAMNVNTFSETIANIEKLREPFSTFLDHRVREASVFADAFRTDEFRLALERLAEEIEETPDQPNENVAVAFVKAQVRRLNANQKQELERTSWTTLLLIIIFILDHYNAYLSEAENAAQHGQTQTSVQQVQDAVDEITKIAQEEVAENAERERVGALPRAVVKNRAYVRVEPKQGAEKVSVLGRDAMVSIEAKMGRWLLVSYENHLGKLESGWIYRGSLEIL